MVDFAENIESLYKNILLQLEEKKFPFMVGGGLAVREYAPDIGRPMKDLDIFVKAGDYPRIVMALRKSGFKVKVVDERWLGKVTNGRHGADLIFSSHNYLNPVDDSWFPYARDCIMFGMQVKIIAPEELIWCKAYIQERKHYDGSDINHIILHQGKKLAWKRILQHMESHWDLLLSILLNYRFVYPSERENVPKWLMEELVSRLENQLSNPRPRDRNCRGPLLSRTGYQADMEENQFHIIT